MSDQMLGGRRFRILAVVDDATRECLTLVADTSLSGARVVRERDAVITWRGKPACIVSHNGTELTSNAVLAWSDKTSVRWHTSLTLQASRSRTASSRASTAACGTRC